MPLFPILNKSSQPSRPSCKKEVEQLNRPKDDHAAELSSTSQQSQSSHTKLTFERIETASLRIPLHKRYIGRAYSMTSRCTVIPRRYTREGIVGEVYTGDTDEEQEAIVRIIHEELA